MVTPQQLRQIIPTAGVRADSYAGPLSVAMERHEINTPARAAAFLAQIAHESASLRYVRELASGESYDTGSAAVRLGNTPAPDGDGQRYKGRGLIQITGRDNYAACGRALGCDLLTKPDLLEGPELAAMSAAWFWQSRGLNALADRGSFLTITRRINGGLNGLTDRQAFWTRALAILAD